MKTIEEHNRKRKQLEPEMTIISIPREWVGLEIECPCGCGGELEELHPTPFGSGTYKERIRCSETKREGWIKYDGSIRMIVVGLEWDEEENDE